MYKIAYRNQGKTEQTPVKYESWESAKKAADFLKFQGATNVKVLRTI